jgi:hypothetical protein
MILAAALAATVPCNPAVGQAQPAATPDQVATVEVNGSAGPGQHAAGTSDDSPAGTFAGLTLPGSAKPGQDPAKPADVAQPGPYTVAQAASETPSNLFSRLGAPRDVMAQLFQNGKAGLMARSSYFYRSKLNYAGPPAQAWGLGGWLFGETGEIYNLLSFGGAFYSVAPIQNPTLGGGNFILKDPGQDGYSTIGEIWGRLRFADWAVFTAGRQALSFGWSLDGIARPFNRYDGAFIGRRDVRAMLPLDFNAATLTGKLADDTIRYYGGYANQMRQINDPAFKNLAAGAFLPGDSSGMGFVGVQWKATPNFMLQGAYNQAQNLLNMEWVDADYVWRLGQDRYVRFDGEFIGQTGTGDNNLNTQSAQNGAAYIEARWWPLWVPYAMIGRNSGGADLRSPYSLGPSYLVQRIGENAVAGEHTWIVGSMFDFKTLKVPGLIFDVSYGKRTQRHVADDSNQPLPEWRELATDLIYTFGPTIPLGWLPWTEEDEAFSTPNGLRTRIRWARVWQTGNNTVGGAVNSISAAQTDFRIDMQWLIQFK